MKNFKEMGLPEALIHRLQHIQFNDPTPIQAQAIPIALQGQDVLGSAQTGTGKTAAFGIPLIAKLLSKPNGSALVMTPTRELATQVMVQLQAMLGKKTKIQTALLIGGESMPKQLRQLKQSPRIIVGTPGRINDHLKRGSLKLDDTDFLVLDETDRMLDMGFSIQIENIMEYLPDSRQTLLFSATLPKNIVRIAEKYLNNPVRIAASPESSPIPNIQQDMIKVNDADKYTTLITQLNARMGSVIIFVKTKFNTEKLAKKLSKDGHSANAIHGDLRQNKRERVLASFRNSKYRILVATDVAARGLDIPHIEHVINYDLPQCPEDYIHRIGRTARAGAQGAALNLVSPSDKAKWNAIERLLNPNGARPNKDKKPSKRKNFNSKSKENSKISHNKKPKQKHKNHAKTKSKHKKVA